MPTAVPMLCRLLVVAGPGWPPSEPPTSSGYRPQPIRFLPHDDHDGPPCATNVDGLRFTGLPACTPAGVEVLSVGLGRLWSIPALEADPVPAGGDVVIPPGVLHLSLAELMRVWGCQRAR